MAKPRIRVTSDSTNAGVRTVAWEIYDGDTTTSVLASGTEEFATSCIGTGRVGHNSVRQWLDRRLEEYMDANNILENPATGQLPASGGQQASIAEKVSVLLASPVTWTNMPLADTEFSNLPRDKLDLSGCTQARLIVRLTVAGASGADLRAQYSLNQSSWANLDGANGPELSVDSAGTLDSGWFVLDANARVNDVFLRIMGKDGNGTADPQFRNILLRFK